MDPLVEYRIPVKGLTSGLHQYNYQINGDFLANFEYTPVTEAKLEVDLELEKKPGLYTLSFDFQGTVRTTCDRCLAEIDLPIQGKERLLVKLSLEPKESDDPEVVYLPMEEQHLSVASFIYEFIVLAIPMIKVYACEAEEPPVCDQNMLDRLSGEKDQEEDSSEEEVNPIWEELKKFNSNQ